VIPELFQFLNLRCLCKPSRLINQTLNCVLGMLFTALTLAPVFGAPVGAAYPEGIINNGQAVEFARVIPSEQLRSGFTFISDDLRSLQSNDDLNPAFLWVIQGETLWKRALSKDNPSCENCHGESNKSMRGVSTKYPQIDPKSGDLINLEARINLCRTRYQHTSALNLESDEMLGITAYVASASRGLPMNVRIDAQNREHFLKGRSLYYTRMGQINLACTHCHEENWSGKLQGETISQGHINDYPVYRLEWQKLGSLHRRIRACLSGVRAYMFPLGSKELLDLELFLGWRSSDSKIVVESPGVRR